MDYLEASAGELFVIAGTAATMVSCSFHREGTPQSDAPTLIEGLPGHGLVASIAVDQITKQLELTRYGGIRSEEVPPVLSFRDGRVQDTVRVYSGADPDVLTLQSDVMLPPSAFTPFSECVLEDLAAEFDRGIFLAAAPAQAEDQHGDILGVATNTTIEADLEDAGVQLAQGEGLVGGITGALVDECYVRDVPAALLLVRADPHAPDPEAARIVIESALEPLVDFDIDTRALQEQAAQIQQQKEQIAKQFQESQQVPESPQAVHMYQ